MTVKITTIWVPQGAEYQAVCRGLQGQSGRVPEVQALPVGPAPVVATLRRWIDKQGESYAPDACQILVMGLCGSLTPQLGVGSTVLYRSCLDGRVQENVPHYVCDSRLNQSLAYCLGAAVTPVTAVTCDRIICRAQEKAVLAGQYEAAVVDMEGYAVLETLVPLGIPVAMVRVVSDDVHHDLPNIGDAIGPDGQIQGPAMAARMLRQPLAAVRLIQGSLRGLSVLQRTTQQLFGEPPKDSGVDAP